MLTNEVYVNIYLLLFLVSAAAFAGFTFRARLIWKSKEKIEELQRELLRINAVILDMEKESSHLEALLQNVKSPVIAMKALGKDDTREMAQVPDISLRKQLLTKDKSDNNKAANK